MEPGQGPSPPSIFFVNLCWNTTRFNYSLPCQGISTCVASKHPGCPPGDSQFPTLHVFGVRRVLLVCKPHQHATFGSHDGLAKTDGKFSGITNLQAKGLQIKFCRFQSAPRQFYALEAHSSLEQTYEDQKVSHVTRFIHLLGVLESPQSTKLTGQPASYHRPNCIRVKSIIP